MVCAESSPSRPRPSLTVQGLLRRHLPAAWSRLGDLDPHTVRVLHRLRDCRTAEMGAHKHVCGHCGWSAPVYNRCGDRHCPTCSGGVARTWEKKQAERMLSMPHFQVVFTLPAELRPLARLRPAWVYGLLMRTAARVLATQAGQRWTATPGITAVLHTWTTELLHHPHVHLLMTAGGLRDDGTWHTQRQDYLFPTKLLGERFRGAVLEALIDVLDTGELELTQAEVLQTKTVLRAVSKRHHRWVVHVEPPKGRPVAAIRRYLARYVGRVAITDDRLRHATSTHVTFSTRTGTTTVSGVEFVRRFVQHILPQGLHRVRHYGLYAAGAAKRLERARDVLTESGDVEPMEEANDEVPAEPLTCPDCGGTAVYVLYGDVQRRGWGAPTGGGTARGPP